MKYRLTLVLALFTALAVPAALAETLTSGNYTIYDTVTSGGQGLTSGNYTIYDLKGQPAAGELTSGNYKVQLGGIYGLFGESVSAAPTNFTIKRNPDGSLVLGWTGAAPDIYYMTGDGTGKFSNTYPGAWIKVVPNTANEFGPISENSLTVYANKAASSPEMYFRAVPAGANPAGVSGTTTIFAASPAVGKFTYSILQGFNFISIPFVYDGNSGMISAALGTQLTSGALTTADRIYFKDVSASWAMPNAYLSAAGTWRWSNTDADAGAALVNNQKGYLIRKMNPGSESLVLVGPVAQDVTAAMNQGFNSVSVGLPIGYKLNTDSLGLETVANVTAGALNAADRIYLKDAADSWAMKSVYLSSKSPAVWRWTNTDGVVGSGSVPAFRFGMPYGYYYRVLNAVPADITWTRKL